MSIQLPKLSLPTFNGDKIHWQAFWDLFVATIDENTSLSNVEKLSYLHTCLSGEAKKCIVGLGISDRSYSKALSILNSR